VDFISNTWSKPGTLLLLILLAAAILRFSLLDSKSLWYDEAYTVDDALSSQEHIWRTEPNRIDSHPPLYYSGMHYWVRVVGTSETAARLPSVLISTVGIAVIFLLARRLFGIQVALLSAALLAVSPLDHWYAQEARMYIFMAVILLLAAYLLTWQSWWSILPLGIVLTAGLYTDYTMLLLWIGLSAVWFIWWWEQGQPTEAFIIWFTSAAIALILFVPWYGTFFEWLGRFSEVTFYIRISEITGLPALSAWQYLLVAVAGGIALIPVFAFTLVLLNQSGKHRWLPIMLLLGFLIANILFVLPRFYSLKRVLVQGWPFVILLVAWLVLQSPRWKLWAGILLAVSLLASLAGLIFVDKDDWRSTVAYTNQNSRPGDVVVLEPFFNTKPTEYYGLIPPIEAIARIKEPEYAPTGDIWLLVQRQPGREDIISTTEEWLDANLQLQEAVPFPRMEVRRYILEKDVKRPRLQPLIQLE
jgi:4-amino-4-deoxy-L-arabinose transferase-like glycosyltransferase